MSQNSNNKYTALHYLAGYQMLGAIVGAVLSLMLLLNNLAVLNFSVAIIIVIAVLLYFYSFLSGYVLLKDKSVGLTLSLINQVLQLIAFTFGGVTFQYISGIGCNYSINFTEEMQMGLHITISSWQFVISGDSANSLSINLVALALIIFILYRVKKERLEKEVIHLDGIGAEAEHSNEIKTYTE